MFMQNTGAKTDNQNERVFSHIEIPVNSKDSFFEVVKQQQGNYFIKTSNNQHNLCCNRLLLKIFISSLPEKTFSSVFK